MINARESLDLLLNSNKLDSLLVAARAKVAGIEKKTPARGATGQKAVELEQRVHDVKKLSAQAITDLQASLRAKLALRADKVATVRHLLQFGSRLQPA